MRGNAEAFCKLHGKTVVVLGAGASGIASARLAVERSGGASSAKVYLVDSGDSDALRARVQNLEKEGIHVVLDAENHLDSLPPADVCVVSPGVPVESALFEKIVGKECGAVLGELEFGACDMACCTLAVTGTNGKTTTVEMLNHCLNAAGISAVAAGNIGVPLTQVATEQSRQSTPLAAIALEVSSYQLEALDWRRSHGAEPQQSPLVLDSVALLNLTPDHLLRHHTMEDYLRVKLAAVDCVKAGRPCVVQYALFHTQPLVRERLACRPVLTVNADGEYTSAVPPADFAVADGALARYNAVKQCYEPLIRLDELPYVGRHNYENALAVLALGEAGGFSASQLAPHLRTFAVGPHRLQPVAVENANAIRYIDDSKATNIDALVQALHVVGGGYPTRDGFVPPVALIAGGLAKGCDLAPVAPLLRRFVRGVFLIGASKEQLRASWSTAVPCVCVQTLREAVEQARRFLLETTQDGDAAVGRTVLLSPGCASQDMFTDYAERGRQFAAIAERLATCD